MFVYIYLYIYTCFYVFIYTSVYLCMYLSKCKGGRAAPGCRTAAAARVGGKTAEAVRGAGGPPASPEPRCPGGDVSGFPSERRAGASPSPAPVRCSRTWEGDRPAFLCFPPSLRPLRPTFPPLSTVLGWVSLSVWFFLPPCCLLFDFGLFSVFIEPTPGEPVCHSLSVAPAPPNSAI